MKKLVIATAVALTLTACATGNEAYYAAIKEREQRIADQELRSDTAIAQMAASGDAQAKGMAIMYFASKGQQSKTAQQHIAAPKSVAEQILPWASLLVPSITQIYGIKAQTDVAIINSNNALEGRISDNQTSENLNASDNGMIVDLVQGRIQPIVGGEGDVLLYPN